MNNSLSTLTWPLFLLLPRLGPMHQEYLAGAYPDSGTPLTPPDPYAAARVKLFVQYFTVRSSGREGSSTSVLQRLELHTFRFTQDAGWRARLAAAAWRGCLVP